MQTELIKWYLILLVITIILYSLVERKVKGAKTYRKRNLLYCILGGMCFGVATLSGLTGLVNFSLYYFIVIQVLLLVVGIFHSHFLFRILPWSSRESFWWELLISIMVACIGAIFMLFIFASLKLTGLYFVMISAIAWFFVPFFFVQAVNRYMAIPKMTMKKWLYPINQEIAPPTDKEMAAPVVITFEFQKRDSDPEKTVFRAKAPLSMQFGRLFYYFINDYNDRHPDTPIEIVLDGNKPYGWVYHFKQRWYHKTRYLDPEATIEENQVRENSVIVCQRVNKS
jgi:hypothetical protein